MVGDPDAVLRTGADERGLKVEVPRPRRVFRRRSMSTRSCPFPGAGWPRASASTISSARPIRAQKFVRLELLRSDHAIGDMYSRRLRGLLLRRLRVLQDEKEDRRRRALTTESSPSGWRRRILVLQALRVRGAAAPALRRTPGFRVACVPQQRGPQLHRRRVARLSISRATQAWGIPIPWDPSKSPTSGPTRSSTI